MTTVTSAMTSAARVLEIVRTIDRRQGDGITTEGDLLVIKAFGLHLEVHATADEDLVVVDPRIGTVLELDEELGGAVIDTWKAASRVISRRNALEREAEVERVEAARIHAASMPSLKIGDIAQRYSSTCEPWVVVAIERNTEIVTSGGGFSARRKVAYAYRVRLRNEAGELYGPSRLIAA